MSTANGTGTDNGESLKPVIDLINERIDNSTEYARRVALLLTRRDGEGRPRRTPQDEDER